MYIICIDVFFSSHGTSIKIAAEVYSQSMKEVFSNKHPEHDEDGSRVSNIVKT